MARNGQPEKRKRSQDESDETSVGATLKRVKNDDFPQAAGNGDAAASHSDASARAGDWQTVESKSSKKRRNKRDGSNYPAITHSANARLQSFVKLADLQNLVLYLLADGTAPNWVSVKHHTSFRKVVVLMVPGLEEDMFNGKISLSPSAEQPSEAANGADSAELGTTYNKDSSTGDVPATTSQPYRKPPANPDEYYPTKLRSDCLPASLQPLADVFNHLWPIRTPGEDKNARMHSPLAAMLTTPIPKSKDEKKAKGQGPRPPREGKGWQNESVHVSELLASTQELADEGYVLHPAHYSIVQSPEAEQNRRKANRTTEADGWFDTLGISSVDQVKATTLNDPKESPVSGRELLVMDCEMCVTSPTGVTPTTLALTRVSIVNWEGKVVLDELVQPSVPITDYVTQFSGITPAMLEGVTTNLSDVQAKLKDLLAPGTILAGHSLNSDFDALKVTHPYIIDTIFLYPHPRGPPLKPSLKWLTQKYLSREIQKGSGSTGHDSIEDARACLDLIKQKCEKGKLWGTSEASGEPIFSRLGRSTRLSSLSSSAEPEKRTSAVVDWGIPKRGYGGAATTAIGCESDEEVVAGIKRVVFGDESIPEIPIDGVDFVWARLRELEAYRGWWNKSKLVDTDALRSATTDKSASSHLGDVVAKTVQHVKEVYESLPPCSALVVYSGSGDPRDLQMLQEQRQKFRDEYRVKKWDELSVKWTDVEEQRLRAALEKARRGVGFIGVK